MNRRIIVMLCLLWGIGCMVLPFIYANYCRNADATEHAESVETLPAQQIASFSIPAQVPGTDLVIQEICSYDGAFWEDGSGQQVIGVTALLVENKGNYGIDKARITMCRGERLLKFVVETVPPGEKVVILEEGRAPFRQDAIKYCFGQQRLQLNGWEQTEVVWDNPSVGTLVLKNCTDVTIRNLCIKYKDCLQGLCIGGKANSYVVHEILPGETVSIFPERYAGVHSKILSVVAE